MNSVHNSYQEKRNFIRMKVETPVNVVIASGSQTLKGICKDLSGGGMLIEINTALPVDTQVEVEIASEHGHSPILKAKARVSRVESQPNSSERPCIIGMEIIEVLNE